MPDGDQGRWLSYQELGELLGCTANAARMHAVRRNWPRRSPNRVGDCATVLVPAGLDVQPRVTHAAERVTHESEAPSDNDEAVQANGHDAQAAEFDTRATHEVLREQLAIANRRADEERQERLLCVARAEQRATEDRAEIRDLRQQMGDALTAERIARDEAAGLRAELDARRQWGLRRRLRWALSRRR